MGEIKHKLEPMKKDSNLHQFLVPLTLVVSVSSEAQALSHRARNIHLVQLHPKLRMISGKMEQLQAQLLPAYNGQCVQATKQVLLHFCLSNLLQESLWWTIPTKTCREWNSGKCSLVQKSYHTKNPPQIITEEATTVIWKAYRRFQAK